MTGVARMVVLVGIDEAGFGPILGPLVVSSSTFALPHHLLTSDLWQVLQKSLSDKRKRLAGRLLVADSKKAYSRALGIGHLERTVLTVLKCLGKEPATLGELLDLLAPRFLEQLCDYPWYEGAGTGALSADLAGREIASAALTRDLAANGIELLGLRSCPLEVAHYNKMVAAVKNKADVLFTATSSLIKHAFDNSQSDELQVIVDRQGGRVRYRNNLQRIFEDTELTILRETPTTSSYELKGQGKRMRVHFVVGADGRFLPVSLASMVSKYLRELLMGNINSYFAGFGAGLKPTAGYWKDGLRFIQDIKTNLPHVKFDSNQLVRCR
jgi:ribonuclease HII